MKVSLILTVTLTWFATPLVAEEAPIKFFATHLSDWSRGHQWILPTPIRQGGESVAANYIRGIEILEITVDGQRLEPQVQTHWDLDKMDEVIECDNGYFLHTAGPSLLSTLSKDPTGRTRMLRFDIETIPNVISIRYRKADGKQEYVMESHVDRTVRYSYEPVSNAANGGGP